LLKALKTSFEVKTLGILEFDEAVREPSRSDVRNAEIEKKFLENRYIPA